MNDYNNAKRIGELWYWVENVMIPKARYENAPRPPV